MKRHSYFLLPEESIKKLADRFDTPFLVVSTEQIESNYRFLQEYMPRVKIHYAVKANPDINILKTLASLGSDFDVASEGEINQLHELGIDGAKMVYANPFKLKAGLKACNVAGVNRFTFDSASELEKIASICPNGDVLLRLKIENTNAIVDLNKKFGASVASTFELFEKATNLGLNVIGLCFHVGSQALTSEPYINGLKRCREIFNQAQQKGYNLTALDIGGGYPVRTMSDDINISKMLTEINSAVEEFFPDIEVWSEPGRFLCATAVNLITRVIGITERNGRPWYFLDDGVYGTFSGVLFDHWEYELISFNQGEPVASTFAGPSCDSLDVICTDYMMPPLKMDDLILVPVCGAYSSASATTFNGFEKAPTVLWEEVREDLQLVKKLLAV